MAARSRFAELLISLLLLGAASLARADTGNGMQAGPNRLFFEARGRRELDLFHENFRLIDSTGRAWTLASESARKRVVLVAWDPSCSGSTSVLQWASDEAKAAASGDVALFFLDPAKPQNRALVESLRSGMNAPVLMDFSQTISKSFGFQHSGDFLVLEPGANWQVLASGAAFGAGLTRALGAPEPGIPRKLWNRAKRFASPDPACAIEYTSEGTDLTAPVADALFRSCVACHLRNQGSDIFHSYSDLKKWHQMNRTVMRLHRMPTGGKDYASSECGRNPVYPDVTAGDLSLVENWIEQGEPRTSGTEDLIADRVHEDLAMRKPQRRKPDISWTAKAVDRIPAQGWLRYVYRQLGPFPKDLFVKGATVRFNGLVTHHLAAFSSPVPLPSDTVINEPRAKGAVGHRRAKESISIETMRSWVKVFEWGNQPGDRFAREGTVFRLPKGSYLILEQHLESVGRVETNRSSLDLFLDPNPAGKLQPRKMEIYYHDFVVPPMKSDFELVKTFTLEEDSSILSATVHGHYRLARYFFKLQYPDGRERPLCNVPYVQMSSPFDPYFYTPVFAPAGSKIEFHLVYDNSSANPLNPDPTASVPEGPYFTNFEMGIAQLTAVPGRIKSAQ